MEIKKNPVMQAIEARAKELEQYIGKKMSVTNLAGTLRHMFTGELFHAGMEKVVEFDSFLLGQLLSGRVTASLPNADEPVIPQPPAIRTQNEGSGVTDTAVKANVEQLIKDSDPLKNAEQPQEPQAPEQPETPQEPAAQTEPEAPAPAAKPSILKKNAQ